VEDIVVVSFDAGRDVLVGEAENGEPGKEEDDEGEVASVPRLEREARRSEKERE